MMTNAVLKKLISLTLALLFLWVFRLYLRVPQTQMPFAKAVDQAEFVVIEQGARKADLHRSAGHWGVVLSTAQVFPADETLVSSFLAGLKNLSVEDQLTDRADRAGDYDVTDASGTRIQLQDKAGMVLASGYFGKMSPDFQHLYFRYADRPNVYLSKGVLRGELGQPDPTYWRSRALVTIPEAKVQGILIQGKSIKTELVRVSTDVWTLGGKVVKDAAPVNRLVGALAHLKADDFVDPVQYPSVTYENLKDIALTVRGAEGSTTLRIGKMDSKTNRYPISSGPQDGLSWISDTTLKTILLPPSAFNTK